MEELVDDGVRRFGIMCLWRVARDLGVPERPVFRLEGMEDPPPCRC